MRSLADDYQIKGLTSSDVSERVLAGEINGDCDVKTKSVAQIVRANGLTFFNVLFIALAVLLAFFTIPQGKGFADFGFLIVVFINFSAGVIQQVKAKRTIDKLTLLSSPKASVMRDGLQTEIAIKDLVLDDLITLKTGNQVSADSVVLSGGVEVNESLVTGESDAVVKNAGDELLSGSFIVSGSAKAKVIRVGRDNYANKISSGAKYIKKSNSVILHSIEGFVKLMAAVIIPVGIALFCVKYFIHTHMLNAPETVITVIGTVIGMIPSGLMLLTSGVFCVGVIRLSSYNALAQDLYCIETLARVDVLCLDKTGTITEGQMEVSEIVPNGIIDDEMLFILKNMNAAINDRNPTAEAIRIYTEHVAITEVASSVIPFSSSRKWSAAEFASGSYVLGAAEFIFKKIPEKMKRILDHHSSKGDRVLVLAKCESLKSSEIPVQTSLLGYIIISDKIRAEAHDTLRYFEEQGVTIKIISGDNPVTVKSIAMRAGVKNYADFVDATTLTDEKALEAAIQKYTIFGRVTPDQKLGLVKALKANGHTVAMTGDGVNDVLALKEADCSVAMASGSDAAKSVSQLVLLDSNFASMPKIVAEGRRSVNNLERSSSLYLVKTGYSFLFALIFMILNAELPFAPRHLTLLGIVTIGIPSFVLALQPNKDRIRGKFFSKVLTNALPGSLAIACAILAVVLFSRLIPGIIEAQISTMCLITTAAVGFTYLIKISIPFNTLRVVLLLSMMFVFACAFFADFGVADLTGFFGITTDLTDSMIWTTVGCSLGAIPLYFGINAVIKLFDRFVQKKNRAAMRAEQKRKLLEARALATKRDTIF
ncbi:MAG: HAD-IC family P-type ATPase [Christensenellaceae bacterium]|jgi:cation-transporting ATPase E|nr:HAD-IC family P-type ATPase [Christensenellaceae bacterium]